MNMGEVVSILGCIFMWIIMMKYPVKWLALVVSLFVGESGCSSLVYLPHNSVNLFFRNSG